MDIIGRLDEFRNEHTGTVKNTAKKVFEILGGESIEVRRKIDVPGLDSEFWNDPRKT